MTALQGLPLLLLASLALAPSGGAGRRQSGEEPLAPESLRLALRRTGSDLARQGEPRAVAAVRDVLELLGDAPDDLALFMTRWERSLARGAPRTSRIPALREELSELALELAEGLADLEPPRRARLARAILGIDQQCGLAAEVAGRTLHEGRWLDPGESERELERRRIADLVRRARGLELDVTHTHDGHVAVRDLFGEPLPQVVWEGRVAVTGPYDHAKLERLLTDSLRAAALSNALLGGELEVPHLRPHGFLLVGSTTRYREALDEALLNRGIRQDAFDDQHRLAMDSFLDRRGWRTSRLRSESDYKALMLWDLLDDWLGRDAQPALAAGHLNWLTLACFGTQMPATTVPEALLGDGGRAEDVSRSSLAEREQRKALWRAARRGLVGCRLWMIERAREQHDPPWSRAMTDHVGRIDGESLLKTTLVVEYLQLHGRLREVLDGTRASGDRAAAFERALGEPLPDFEERWRTWLLGGEPVTAPGIVQLLGGEPVRGPRTEPAQGRGASSAPGSLVFELNRLRARALVGQSPEFEEVAVYPDLSAGATLHAHYLARHTDQLQRWPDAHEEYPDRAGFTPEGSWSGLHSVIWPGTEGEALGAWLGTFYHRLPLLDPGLVGVGLGTGAGVVVLDTDSLVLEPWREHWVFWPPNGASDVPLRFTPELPSPVPGADQSRWGYPITLQVFRVHPDVPLHVALSLTRDESDDGEKVPCTFISPGTPRNPDVAPEDAWCLIPLERLEPRTTYTVRAVATGEAAPRTSRFTTGP